MIEVHPTIDTDQYSGVIKSALLGNSEIKEYQNMMEIDDLTVFDNGIVFVTVVSVYVDWVKTRQQSDCVTISKAIYEAFCEHPKCKEVMSMDNHIVAVFDTPFKTDIDATLDAVGKINAMFNLVDKVYNNKISCGIGMHYGKVLLIKCPNGEKPVYCWSGEGIGVAMNLSDKANKNGRKVLASFTIVNNLKEDYQNLFTKDDFEKYYEADPVNIAMNKWINANV